MDEFDFKETLPVSEMLEDTMRALIKRAARCADLPAVIDELARQIEKQPGELVLALRSLAQGARSLRKFAQ